MCHRHCLDPPSLTQVKDTGRWQTICCRGYGAGWASSLGIVLSVTGTEYQGTDGLLRWASQKLRVGLVFSGLWSTKARLTQSNGEPAL